MWGYWRWGCSMDTAAVISVYQYQQVPFVCANISRGNCVCLRFRRWWFPHRLRVCQDYPGAHAYQWELTLCLVNVNQVILCIWISSKLIQRILTEKRIFVRILQWHGDRMYFDKCRISTAGWIWFSLLQSWRDV